MAHEIDEQDLGAPTEASSDEPDTAEADTDAVVVTDTEMPVGSEGRHPELKLHDWVIVQVDSENIYPRGKGNNVIFIHSITRIC